MSAAAISDSQLVQLVGRIQDDPELLDVPVTTSSLSRAFEELWDGIRQPEIIEVSGDEFTWECLSYSKFLTAMVQESSSLRSILKNLWMARPCTASNPYHLVVYADEVVPGNVLRLDNRRKIFCIYAAIREVGPQYLKCEWLWIPLAAIRSTIAKNVPGSISACFRTVLRRLFLHDRLLEDGVVLDLEVPHGGLARFHFKLGNVLADGDALRAIFSSKGAAGKLPCFLCKNVLSERVAETSGLVYIDCPDVELFLFASSEELWLKADRLHAAHGTSTKIAFEHLQMVYGFTYCPEGLLWDRELRPYVLPAECTTYDSMHVFVSNGIVQNETGYLLKALRGIGVTWDHLRRFAEGGWHFCGVSGSLAVLRTCLNDARERAWTADNKFKSTASEMLVLMPVLLHFLHSVVQPTNQLCDHVASYEALARVVSLTKMAKDGRGDPLLLRRAAKLHGQMFAKAYPGQEVKPKDHFCHHISGQIQRDGLLVDAFTGERKNGMIKRVAADLKNTECFEKSLLMRVASAQLDAIRDEGFLCDHLLAPEASPLMAYFLQVPAASISAAMVFDGMRLRKGDCIFLNDDLFVIRGFALASPTFFLLAENCTFIAAFPNFKNTRLHTPTLGYDDTDDKSI